MNSKANHLWLLVGVIWLAASGTTYWNFSRIDALTGIREHNERLRREMLFQHRNDRWLTQIRKAHESCQLPAASIKLGFETVRGQLNALAAQLGLRNLKIEPQTVQPGESQMPFSLNVTGDFEEVRRYSSALPTLPYLSIERFSLTVLISGREAEIETELSFQFNIKPEDLGERRPLQASAYFPPSRNAGP